MEKIYPITRQEKILAGKDIEPITRLEYFLKQAGSGGGGGVQSDWNQTDDTAADFIKNKPVTMDYGDTITIEFIPEENINPDNLVGGMFFKVSNATPDVGDLANGCLLSAGDHSLDLSVDDVVGPEGFLILTDFILVVVPETAVGVDIEGIVFLEAGTYTSPYFALEFGGSWSVTIPGYNGFGIKETLRADMLPVTYWYISSSPSDKYLYVDPALATKVTAEEFHKGANTIIRIKEASALIIDCYNCPIEVNDLGTHSNIRLAKKTSQFNSDALETVMYYVAEYPVS